MCAAGKRALDEAAEGVQAATVSSTDAGDLVGLMLDGLEHGVDLSELHRSIGDRFLSDRTLSPRVLLELAAEAFIACRVSREDPLELDELDRRLYPEWPARGNTAHQKRRYALGAAILIAVGVEPEDASWWRHDDLWSHSFDAVIVFVRAAAERRAVSVVEICDELRANVR
jgi:hypothetical protein